MNSDIRNDIQLDKIYYNNDDNIARGLLNFNNRHI